MQQSETFISTSIPSVICQGNDFCCLINVLDNPKKDDFEYCEIDHFSGDLLGGCQNFALDPNKKLKIYYAILLIAQKFISKKSAQVLRKTTTQVEYSKNSH